MGTDAERDEWVGLAATYADHQELGPERLAALQRALRSTIEEIGGTVRSAGGTHVLLACRA